MPELPEVETVTKQIRPELVGQKFLSVEFSDKNLRYNIPKERFDNVLNSEILSVKRRAKYIQIFFANHHVLVLHLGMSGKLLIANNNSSAPGKHDHIIVNFTGSKKFTFNDPRRFGMFDVVPENQLESSVYFKNLGVEALDAAFNTEYLYSLCQRSSSSIKALIMNQANVVGVGNIYALESLFQTKIHPAVIAKKLTKKQCDQLVASIKKILLIAIEKGGSSIRDYKQVDGSSAYFQHEFFVYGKEGKVCKICQTKIERIVQNNRSSFFCPSCQFV